jgi:ankyrin repeat protein
MVSDDMDHSDSDRDPTTALQNAVWQDDFDMVNLLLDSGADINAKGGFTGNALNSAIGSIPIDIDMVRLLLDRGAKVNATGGFCGTALAFAAYRGWLGEDVVRLLLERGALVELRGGGRWQNALHAAISWRRGPAPCNDWGHPETVKMLVDAGADIDNIPSQWRSDVRKITDPGWCTIQ